MRWPALPQLLSSTTSILKSMDLNDILFLLVTVVGLVASILINVFLFVKLKRSRSIIGSTNQSCKEINNGNQPTDTKYR